jgi:phosphoadenosine phosphosulfate reductase
MAAVSVVTVIDAQRALHRTPIADAQRIDLLARADGRDARGLLELALKEEFAGRTAVVSSFGSESAVLLHLVAQVEPATPILFLNTGKLFGETLRYRDRLQDELGLTDIRAIGPHPIARAQRDPDGTLWSRDTDACCGFRKAEPLNRVLFGFDAVITGRKQFQTVARIAMQPVEFFGGRYRINPLWNWTRDDLDSYFDQHRLPKHPLVDDGYASIGCIPCTRRLETGEIYREGRWSGLAKDECGIHTGLNGEGI